MDGPLVDGYGRVHRSLRLSVTDRCNLRCRYCMPAEGMDWLPKGEILTFEEIARLIRLLASMGIHDLRLTGGEPLVRRDVVDLVREVAAVPGIREITMTSNGVLLADAVDDLVAAGLSRINVSLDSLDPERFAAITRRDDLARVLAGLTACERHATLRPIKVNAVLQRGLSEPDILPLAEFARTRPYVMRFIETMPLDAPRQWTPDLVLSGAEVRARIAEHWPLEPEGRDRPSAPGTRWRFADGAGSLEFISSVTESFCNSCDRLRITADGQLRTCLFAETETDLRGPMRAGATEPELAEIIRTAVGGKGPGHGLADPAWIYAGRPMSMIGG